MKKSIGLDIGKKSISVSIFDGEHYRDKIYGNTKKGLGKMVKDFKKEGNEVIITMEATGTYYLKSANMLHGAGFDVRVENPLVIKRYSELKLRRVKTDKADARIIASFGYRENPSQYKAESKEKLKLKVLVREIEQLKKDINRNRSRIEALKQYPEKMEGSIKRFEKKNKRMKQEIKEIQREINEIIKRNDSYRKASERLQTIKGVGERLSSAIISSMGEYEEFESAKQVASYIGITPSLKQSGISVKGKGNISKMGNKYIRSLLVMCARSAMRYNPQCKALNDRLESKGKKYRERLVAVGHKLLRQTYGVIKNGQDYDLNYVTNKQEVFVSA